MQIEAFAACDIGLQRDINEDRYFVDDELSLLAVSDGMGGHAAGEVAAARSLEIATKYLRDRLPVVKAAKDSPDGYFRVLQVVEDALEEASRQLYQEASSNAEQAGMGATMTMLLVVGDKGMMAHVGDSRLYLVRDGKLHLLSSDHTMAHELCQAGMLTREEAEKSPYSHVLTRSIGTQQAVQVESLLFDLIPGDRCLICSDGLSNYFQEDIEVVRLLCGEDLGQVPQKLVDLAKSRGGKDNITAIVSRVLADSSDRQLGTDLLKQCLEAMKAVFLFRGLSLSRLTRLINIAEVNDYRRGATVIAAGDPCGGMYLVLSGQFSLTDNAGTTEELTAGHWFGADTLLHLKKSGATVVAEEASRMMYFAGPMFDKLTQRQPKLGRRLLRRLGQHLSAELHRRTLDQFDPSDTVDWE